MITLYLFPSSNTECGNNQKKLVLLRNHTFQATLTPTPNWLLTDNCKFEALLHDSLKIWRIYTTERHFIELPATIGCVASNFRFFGCQIDHSDISSTRTLADISSRISKSPSAEPNTNKIPLTKTLLVQMIHINGRAVKQHSILGMDNIYHIANCSFMTGLIWPYL